MSIKIDEIASDVHLDGHINATDEKKYIIN